MGVKKQPEFKDEDQLCFTDWEKVNIETLNGLLASNYYASNNIIDKIPQLLRKSDGAFPSIVNFGKDMYGFFSRVKFGGTCTVNSGKISLDPGQTLILNIYPNVEPFVSWNEFNIETNSESKLSFKMNRFSDNGVVFAEESFDSFENKTNIKLASTEYKEMVITITNRGTTNILINSISYEFTIESRLNDLLSDLNAGLLNGKTEKQLLDYFLSMITKSFLSGIIGPSTPSTPSNITADDSKKLGGETLNQIKNLIPILKLDNSYDDAKDSAGHYMGSDAVFTLRLPSVIGSGNNSAGNKINIKGVKFYLHVNKREVNIQPNASVTTETMTIPNQGGNFVLRPFIISNASTPKLTVGANVGVNSYNYSLRNRVSDIS